ncbi:MAG: GntR family transcriptional regulator [Sulfitobacter sp.]
MTPAPTAAQSTKPLHLSKRSVTLRQRVYDKLRQAIIERRLPPGTKLVERDLCEQLGVSRPSLREALRHLESEALIEMVPHKGSVVATLTARDVREIYDIRASLEGLVCERFAEFAADEHIALLQQSYADLGQAAKQDNVDGILRAKTVFYQTLFEGSGCAISQNLLTSLNARIEVLRRMSITRKDRNPRMMDEIKPIIEAAIRRDGPAMKASCIAHLEGARRAALTQLSIA